MTFSNHQIEPSDTIEEVKKKIRNKEGIPLDEQLLVINDTEADDRRTVSYYNMNDNSAIHLIRMSNATNPVVPSPVSMHEV